MNAEKAIGAETSVALLGVVAGDLIGQGADRTLPKPRRILATLFFYSLLSLMTAFGAGPARLAAAAGAVVAMASLVLGSTGRVLIDVIDRATGLLTTPGSGAASSGSPSSGAAPSGFPPAPPGYNYVQGPSGWSLVPIDPNRATIPNPKEASGRVRSPQPVGGLV